MLGGNTLIIYLLLEYANEFGFLIISLCVWGVGVVDVRCGCGAVRWSVVGGRY